jgi:hypothetical protein
MRFHSPVIFWLLLTATICVDAVLVTSLAADGYPAPVRLIVAFHALVIAQLSIVCIWSVMSAVQTLVTRGVLLLAPIVAAFVTAVLIDKPMALRESLPNHVAHLGLHVALLAISLWLLQRTRFWQRCTGFSHDLRYSVFHLLIAMTLVAVLAVAMRSSSLLGADGWANAAFMLSSVAIALASVMFWVMPWHWLLRLAATLGLASLLSLLPIIAMGVSSTNPGTASVSLIFGAHFLIQALMISIWLGCGLIVPVVRGPVSAER